MNDDHGRLQGPASRSTTKNAKTSPSPIRSPSTTVSWSSSCSSTWMTKSSFSGQEIIGNIDEDGYLRRDLAAIVQDLNLTHGTAISLEKAESVLKQIQRLDPVGIGSRSLQECLTRPARSWPRSTLPSSAVALRILTEFYDDFTMRHFEELTKKLGISIDELKRVIEADPAPEPETGRGGIHASSENYVVPDFIVTKSEDGLRHHA